MEFRYVIDILLQVMATALRASNNVINVAFEQLWDKASITRANLLFNISHVQTSATGIHLAPHGHATNLNENLKAFKARTSSAGCVSMWVGGSLLAR